MDTAIEVVRDKEMIFGPGVLRPLGLTLPDDLSEDDWKELGSRLTATEPLQWAVADWIQYGIKLFKKKKKVYEMAMTATGYRQQTLYAYKCVAEALPLESCRRIQGLSFSHHRAVILAGLEPEAEDYYLMTAKDKGIESVDKLEQRILTYKDEGTGYFGDAPKNLTADDLNAQPLLTNYGKPALTDAKALKVAYRLGAWEEVQIENLREHLKDKHKLPKVSATCLRGLFAHALANIGLRSLGFEASPDDLGSQMSTLIKAIESLAADDAPATVADYKKPDAADASAPA